MIPCPAQACVSVTPSSLFFRSLALAPFVLLVIFSRSRSNTLKVIYNSGLAAIIGGLGLVLAFTSGIFAVQTTTVANAMLLFAAAPFITALVGWVLLNEHVRTATWVCIVIAIIGICTMVWNSILIGHLVGNISALLSAVGFSIFTIALRWKKLEDMMPTVLIGAIFALIISGVICLKAGYTLNVPNKDLIIAFLLGIFQVGTGMVIYTLGSKAVPAAELALLSMTEVILGPLWAWLFLDELFDFFTLIGGSILLSAIIGNALSGIRRKPLPLI